jgi:hypothetical protein
LIAFNTSPLNGTDILSLLGPSAAPTGSTDSSVPLGQDFTAMLTELIGPAAAPAVSTNSSAPVVQNISGSAATDPVNAISQKPTLNPPTQVTDDPGIQGLTLEQIKTPAGPQTSSAPSKAQDPQKPEDPQKLLDPQTVQTSPLVFVPFVALGVHAAATNQNPIATPDVQGPSLSQKPDPAMPTVPVSVPAALQLQMQQAWADVKKFELTLQNEIAKPGRLPIQAQAQPALEEPANLPVVATDPMANIQIQQLPPRIMAIEKLVPETALPQRTKPDTGPDTGSPTVASTVHFSDLQRPMIEVEQARPAQPVEIPQLPHVQVVRTIAMEVGDAGSQVTVRIQERAGDISMQINTPNEPLHQDLQSSLGSLVHALKQEQVPVSNVEVSRKSPINKVRRMKEAN